MKSEYLFEVLSKATNYKYKVYKVKRKRNGKIYYKIYNYFTDTFEWWFSDRFVINELTEIKERLYFLNMITVK